MTANTVRRLPDGNLTKDVDRYCSAWQELGDAVAQFFPYYQLSAYDPGICLSNGVETLRFSVPQAMLLLQTTSTLRAELEDTPRTIGKLYEALEWYVTEDDTSLRPSNREWLRGQRRALRALAMVDRPYPKHLADKLLALAYFFEEDES